MNDELTKNCINCKHYRDNETKYYGEMARGYCCHPIASLPRKTAAPQYLQGAYPWDCLCKGPNAKFCCVYKHTGGYKDGSCQCLDKDGRSGNLCPYGVRAVLLEEKTEIGPLELDDRTVRYSSGCPGFEMQDADKAEQMFRSRCLNRVESESNRKKALIKLGFTTKSNVDGFIRDTKALDLFANIEPCLANRATDEGKAARILILWIAESLGTYERPRSIKQGGLTISPWTSPALKKLISEAEHKAREKFSKKKGKKC